MKKRTQVIRLATDTEVVKGDICLHPNWGLGIQSSDDESYDGSVKQHLYFVDDSEIKEGDWYLFDNDGWKLVNTLPKGGMYTAHRGAKKIIATTDSSLNTTYQLSAGIDRDGFKAEMPFVLPLPQIPQTFIEEYCKQGGIDEVDVEYENRGLVCTNCNYPEAICLMEKECQVFASYGIELKVNSNNEIITHHIKDSWNRDEVESLIRDCFGDVWGAGNYKAKAEDWIEKNV